MVRCWSCVILFRAVSPADVLLVHQEVDFLLSNGFSGWFMLEPAQEDVLLVEQHEDDRVNLLLILCIILQNTNKNTKNSWNGLGWKGLASAIQGLVVLEVFRKIFLFGTISVGCLSNIFGFSNFYRMQYNITRCMVFLFLCHHSEYSCGFLHTVKSIHMGL